MKIPRTLGSRSFIKPHLSKYWKISPDQNASFVAAMEDVLEVYAQLYDKAFPVVCSDEPSVQLIGEMDNLNTHNLASLYTAFTPEVARGLGQNVSKYITHLSTASWLNTVEIELSVLKRQCLVGRIASIEKMRTEVHT